MYNVIRFLPTSTEIIDWTPDLNIAGITNGAGAVWIDIDTQDTSQISTVLSLFGVEMFVLEEVGLNDSLPRFESFDNSIVLKMNMLRLMPGTSHIQPERVYLILNENVVFSVQEGKMGDVFDRARKKFMDNRYLNKHDQPEKLFCKLIESVVDSYHYAMEEIRDRIEDLEALAVSKPDYNILQNIIRLKSELSSYRKITIPVYDEILRLMDEQEERFDHSMASLNGIINRLNDIRGRFETDREMLRDLMELHKANINQNMNQVMKALTVITAIFIPLTFIVGVYGMNFKFMPETEWKLGYLYAWIVMLCVGIGMFMFMRRKKWM